jgi:sarcosine oxidase, subunit gamma
MTEAAKETTRRPPLGDGASGSRVDLALDLVAVRLLPPRARLVLRIDPALLPASGEVAGFPLDMPINRYRASARGQALRLGPDEWLLWAHEAEARGVAADVATALAGRHLSLVDISHGRAAFAVSGAEAASVLNSGCPLHLSPAAFPVGAATRTLLGKCEVILARADDPPTFEVECGRSFARYLRDFLLAAVRGIGSPGLA